MYIDRPSDERHLARAVRGSLHVVLCGESGSGKSWLYKHVAEKERWTTFYANAGNAARYKSLTKVVELAVRRKDERELTEYSQEFGAEVKPLRMGASGKTGRKYRPARRERLLEAFDLARKRAGNRHAVLIVDNFEAMFSKQDLMEELGNIILLLDDPDYADYEIKILIVGVPSDVVEYYQRIPNLETVSNRLTELPPLFSLNWGQIEDFVRRGFVGHLKVNLSTAEVREIALHLDDVTLGIPQRLHEYCELLGHHIEDSEWKYDSSLLRITDERFLRSSLKKAYTVVNSFMNARKSKTGRRNQLLYALGRVKSTELDLKAVEAMVRTEFPISTYDTALAVGQMMTELSQGDAPLLRRAPKGYTYRFADPRYLMCIRAMLLKNADESVHKATLRR
jgi:hypothetical protein